jgi:transcriptional regulator with XRE-family HTH domain
MSSVPVRTFSPGNVTAARLRAGMSVMRVAADADLHYNSLRAIEAGRAVPRANTVARLADVLGVTVDSLFEAS